MTSANATPDPSPVIKALCPSCSKSFWAKESQAGKRVACKFCKKPVTISSDPEEVRIRLSCASCESPVMLKPDKVKKKNFCSDCKKKQKNSTSDSMLSLETIESEILKKNVSSQDRTSRVSKEEIEQKKALLSTKLSASSPTSKSKGNTSALSNPQKTSSSESSSKKLLKASGERSAPPKDKKETLKKEATKEEPVEELAFDKTDVSLPIATPLSNAYAKEEELAFDKTDVSLPIAPFAPPKNNSHKIEKAIDDEEPLGFDKTETSLPVSPLAIGTEELSFDKTETSLPMSPSLKASTGETKSLTFAEAGDRKKSAYLESADPFKKASARILDFGGSSQEPTKTGPLPIVLEQDRRKTIPLTNIDLFMIFIPLGGIILALFLWVQSYQRRAHSLLIRNLATTMLFSIVLLVPMWMTVSEQKIIYQCQLHLFQLGGGMELYCALYKKMPHVSGKDFILCLEKEGLLLKKKKEIVFCPNTIQYKLYKKHPTAVLDNVGYLARRNAEPDYQLENIHNPPWFIPIAACKDYPPRLHGNVVNVLFWDKHVEAFSWDHPELGGLVKKDGNLLEQLIE
jgi:hypothetical protein